VNHPRRWLDLGRALSPAERRVLLTGQNPPVPASAKGAVKSALLARLAAPPSGAVDAASSSPPPSPGPTAVSAVAWGSLLKLTAAGFALGVGASAVASWGLSEGGAERAQQSATPAHRAPAAARSAASLSPQVPSGTQPPHLDSASQQSKSYRGLPAASHDGSPTVSRLASSVSPPTSPSASSFPFEDPQLVAMLDESRRLARARTLLRSNAPREAMALLEGMRRDHPRGALLQERQILMIEGLAAIGESAAAAAAARDFLARYPTSPHAAAARRALPNEPPL
jgi:hypothetical protein